MKVLRYEARNVLRISEVDFDLAGRHLVLVGGKNGQGKTSALTALLMALCGRSGMNWPEVSLKEGEKEGWVRVALTGDEELHDADGFTIELFLRRKRTGQVVEEFRLLDSTGDEAPEPRKTLQRLYDLRAFDPLAFDRLPPKDKRDLLQKLLGLDFAPMDEEYQQLYAERTEVGREGKRARGEYESLQHYDDAPDEELSAGDLMEELERRQRSNAANARAIEEFNKLHGSAADSEAAIAAMKVKILELQSRLAAEEKKYAETKEAIDRQHTMIDSLKDEDVDEVRQQIKDVSAINAKVRENRRRREAGARVESLKDRWSELTGKMAEIEAAKQAALEAAEWPVEGLAIDDDGVLWNGLPLEQASKSQRTIISTKIGMALNPKLRLLVCQDGSDLDSDTLDALGRLCEEEDFQMLLELVTRTAEDEDRCAVVIHDGKKV